MRAPRLSRRTSIAMLAIVAGLVAISVALVSTIGSSADPSGPTDQGKAIKPVPPLDPDDVDAEDRKEEPDPLAKQDDPFATGFGALTKHKVTVRITSRGPAKMGVRYRDDKGKMERLVNGSFETTRKFRGKFPLVQVAAQVLSAGGSVRCEIVIDGSRMVTRSRDGLYRVVVCAA